MTPGAQLGAAVIGCAAGWVAAIGVMRQTNPEMKAFLASKFGRTLIAIAAGALAPAVPALVMGDVHAFRMALSSAAGALATAVALHFKTEGAAS